MMPIVVGEFEPTKLPKKLLGGLFLASQVTQVQGDDDSTAVTQYEEKCEEGFCLSLRVRQRCVGDGVGSLRGGLHVWRSLCEAAGDSCRGRRQVDLLAYGEELVEDLNSWVIQSELVALAGLFVRLSGVWARKTVIAKWVAQTGLVSGYVGAPCTACAC